MKKKPYKLILDILLMVLLITIFPKNFFGLEYHEIAGLLILIPIVVHIAINWKTFRNMFTNFQKLPGQTKAGLIVDCALIIAFLWLGISGIFISKTILTDITTDNPWFRLYHISIGGIAVVLLGLHLGLHISRKRMTTGVAVALTVLAFAAGAYGIYEGKVGKWIAKPTQYDQISEGRGQGLGLGKGSGEGLHQHNGDHRGQQNGKGLGQGQGTGKGQGQGQGQGLNQGLNAQRRPADGRGLGCGRQPMSFDEQVSITIQLAGITFSVAMIVYWLVLLSKNQKKKALNQ